MEIFACVTDDGKVTIRGKVYLAAYLGGGNSAEMSPANFTADISLNDIALMVARAARNKRRFTKDGAVKVTTDFVKPPDAKDVFLA